MPQFKVTLAFGNASVKAVPGDYPCGSECLVKDRDK